MILKKLYDMHLKRFLCPVSILLIWCVLATSCSTSSSKTFSSFDFEKWYLNPDTRISKSLAFIASSAFDSLRNVFREKSCTGQVTDTLLDSSGISYVCGLRTPANFDKKSLYPMVIYLHGGTGTELNNKGENAYEMLLPLADSMAIFLASPSANRDARWWSPDGFYRILQTVRYMSLHYPIDPDRIFLAGVSDGATACWAVANCASSPFAGFFAISGFGGMLPSLGIELHTQNLTSRPIYNINAGNDRLYPLEAVNQFLDYIESKQVPVIRKVYPEENHGFAYRDQEFGTLCTFLRTWKKPSFTGFSWTFTPGLPNKPPFILKWEIDGVYDKRYIIGTVQHDTLVVQARGISNITIRIPEDAKIGTIRAVDGSARRAPPGETAEFELQAMLEMCVPVRQNSSYYHVKF